MIMQLTQKHLPPLSDYMRTTVLQLLNYNHVTGAVSLDLPIEILNDEVLTKRLVYAFFRMFHDMVPNEEELSEMYSEWKEIVNDAASEEI